MTARVSVLLPLPLAGAYDYAVPAGMAVAPGDFVVVPLGSRERIGVVWGPGTDEVAAEKLKPVAAVIDAPALGDLQRRFIDRVAAYAVSPPGAVLRMSMSVPEALEPPKPVALLRPAQPLPDVKLTEARRRVLAVAGTEGRLPRPELTRRAGASSAVVKGLIDAGVLVEDQVIPDPPGGAAYTFRSADLSRQQRRAADELVSAVRAGGFSCTLLEGVTGSGKTEVYFQAIAEALARGRQCLVLLPEIALSAQWLTRFETRFGAPPALWHSDVKRLQKRETWRGVAEGRVPLVVGARSALFLPFTDLGLIVVDEEHDGSFKQDDGVAYNARDMAVLRAHLGDIPAILASATPSLETQANVEQGRYRRVELPSRHGGAALPAMELVDLRRDPPAAQQWMSPVVTRAVAAALDAGEQVMLFLNRRGYAPLTLCRTCGHRYGCPECSAWLVEHRLARRLVCHHCGFTRTRPETCESCEDEDSLAACGPGVERLAEEVQAAFPEARLALMTSDTVRGAAAAEALVAAMEAQEIDILIGTQMMAKGHHFPLLTLVAVIDADLGFAGADPRAAERTWQMLTQVAGRAGRGEKPGRVLLQTYLPEQPVLQALARGSIPEFLDLELEARHEQQLPPYGRMAALVIAGRRLDQVEATARDLARTAPQLDGVRILGPAPAVMAVLRGQHRLRFLVKAGRSVNVQAVIAAWLAAVKPPSGVSVRVDIDPYSFM